jgi:membrane-bound serine protease (ClpP class)
VDTVLDAPALVLVALSLAAALLVIEVALPTGGVAGLLSLVLGIAGVAAIARQDADWWPLLATAVGALLWAVLIARRRRSPSVELTAVVLFAGGAAVFGALAHSWGTAALGVGLALAAGAGFPSLHAAAVRLLDQPVKVGMEALVGEPGRVVAWDAGTGTVRLHGSLWNATAPEPLADGDEVEVVGFSGMTIQVAHRTHQATQGER